VLLLVHTKKRLTWRFFSYGSNGLISEKATLKKWLAQPAAGTLGRFAVRSIPVHSHLFVDLCFFMLDNQGSQFGLYEVRDKTGRQNHWHEIC
jgi:hypothetical protein